MSEFLKAYPFARELNLSQEAISQGISQGAFGVSAEGLKEYLRGADRLNYFTSDERSYCNNIDGKLAGRFAAKAALMKALDLEIPWRHINISSSQSKEPIVHFTQEAEKLVRERGILECLVSISHDEGMAVGFSAVRSAESPNIVRIGTDIVSVKRIEAMISNHGNRLAKVFTEQELSESGKDPQILAQMWAGKEAVGKALGTGLWREGVNWKDIEISLDPNSPFPVVLRNGSLEKAKELQLVHWKISLIQENSLALAFVTAHS